LAENRLNAEHPPEKAGRVALAAPKRRRELPVTAIRPYNTHNRYV
jgi:hypothetical protein